jgi:hypothetical protein
VYLPSGTVRSAGQRGDNVAYIFEGKQLETYPDEPLKVEVSDSIPVLPKGWTDMAHVKRTGKNWVKAKRKRGQKCGVVFVSTPRLHDGMRLVSIRSTYGKSHD